VFDEYKLLEIRAHPTLFAAFLYFDLSFMVWYLLGPWRCRSPPTCN
jgi:nitrate/nitrite transporter NarK